MSSGGVGAAVRSAMIWNTASMVVSQLAMSGIFILLAARLGPHVFGVFALAAAFVDYVAVQGSSAAIDAIVRAQEFSRRMLSTAFWCIMGIVFVPTALLVVGAAPMAEWMNEPDLAPVLIALALTLVPLPLSVAPFAVARQNLDFRGVAIRGMGSSIAGGVCALAVAMTEYWAWALVVQRFVQVFVSTAMIMIHTRVFPTFEFDRKAAGPFLKATGKIFAAQGIEGTVPRFVDVFIGATFGTVLLGCYRVACKLYDVVLSALVNPIAGMWVVLISKAGEDREQRRNVFLQLSRLTALICVPGYIGVALTSGDLIDLMFDENYAPVASMLGVLALTGAIVIPLTNFRNAILTSLGRMQLLIWLSVVDVILVVGGVFAAKPFGMTAVLIALSLQNLPIFMFAFTLILREMGCRARDLLGAIAPPYVAAAVMGAAVLGVGAVLPADAMTGLAGKAVVGVVVYTGVLLLIFKGWTLGVIRGLRGAKDAAGEPASAGGDPAMGAA